MLDLHYILSFNAYLTIFYFHFEVEQLKNYKRFQDCGQSQTNLLKPMIKIQINRPVIILSLFVLNLLNLTDCIIPIYQFNIEEMNRYSNKKQVSKRRSFNSRIFHLDQPESAITAKYQLLSHANQHQSTSPDRQGYSSHRLRFNQTVDSWFGEFETKNVAFPVKNKKLQIKSRSILERSLNAKQIKEGRKQLKSACHCQRSTELLCNRPAKKPEKSKTQQKSDKKTFTVQTPRLCTASQFFSSFKSFNTLKNSTKKKKTKSDFQLRINTSPKHREKDVSCQNNEMKFRQMFLSCVAIQFKPNIKTKGSPNKTQIFKRKNTNKVTHLKLNSNHFNLGDVKNSSKSKALKESMQKIITLLEEENIRSPLHILK